MSTKNVIFSSTLVAAHLKTLKLASPDEGHRWWQPALEFEWHKARKGGNNTQWVSVYYTSADGVRSTLLVRINHERQTGRIMPNTDAGVAELTAELKNPNIVIKKREKKASVQIQKWAAHVRTAEDGVTVPTDETGKPELPGDDKLSPYYQVASLVGEAYAAEAAERVERGKALAAIASAMAAEAKRAKTALTPEAVLAAFVKENGSRKPGDVILSAETISIIRRAFAAPKDQEAILRGAITCAKTNIASLVQEFISDNAVKNKGAPLPNPLTRIAMDFETGTGVPKKLSFYDMDKPYMEGQNQKYEVGKVGNDPVCADNVHKFILPHSGIHGVVNMDSVCFSSMGISMPVKAAVLLVSRPQTREITLDDVFGEDDGFGSAPPAPATTAAASTSATSSAAASTSTTPPAAPAEADTGLDDDLLAELGGTSIKTQ